MIHKLPRWVWIGGWVLAFNAGIINVVGFLSFHHQAVTHLTGTTTLFGIALVQQDTKAISHLFAVIVSFVLGATLSGFIVRDSALKLGRRYGAALLVESILLFAAAAFMQERSLIGDYLASCAAGLQNAMASTFSGAVLRTTHMSGIFTDLGIFLGHYIRRIAIDRKRVILYLILISGFLTGGIIGTLIFQRLNYRTLYVPAGLTGMAAFTYALYRLRHKMVKKPEGSPSPAVKQP